MEQIRKAEELIASLQGKNDAAKKEVEKVTSMSPVVNLRIGLLEFFEKAFKSVEEENQFKRKVREHIEDRMDNPDPEDPMSNAQLISLYNTLGNRSVETLINILSAFKPAPEQDIFGTGKSIENDGGLKQPLRTSDRESIDVLDRFMQELERRQNSKAKGKVEDEDTDS